MAEYRWLKPKNIRSIPTLLRMMVERQPEKTALVYFGRKISYGDLWHSVSRVASYVCGTTKEGELVGLCMPNIPQFPLCYYGALLAGRTVVPINFISLANDLRTKNLRDIRITPEIAAQLADARPSILFVADFLYPVLRPAITWPCRIVVTSPAEFLPFFLRLLYPLKAWWDGRTATIPKTVTRFPAVLRGMNTSPLMYPSPESIAQLQYTGGTTGTPKGAMLSHRNLVTNLLQAREQLGGSLRDGAEVVLGVLPFFHIYGMTVAMNFTLLSVGGTLVLIPAFEAKQVIRSIERHRVTIFPGVNRLYHALVAHEKMMRTHDLSSLKLCVCGAGPIDPRICEKFAEITGTAIVEGYGLSETSPIISFTMPTDAGRIPSARGTLVGTVLPRTQVKILDPGPDDIGEIAVRGPQVMQGYYRKPEETAEVLADGWFRTGDLGYVDKGNRLYFVDRAKDLVKCRGENIYASHVERHLAECALIREAFVVGVPDAKDGESVIACVVPWETPTDAAAFEREVIQFLREKSGVAPLQVPKRVVCFASLDEYKNPIGKILKRHLKTAALERLRNGS